MADENTATPLPAWLTRDDKGVFQVDIDRAYPMILDRLGVRPDEYDQYWIEVAYQCAKLLVQETVGGTEHDPRPDRSLVINMAYPEGNKDKWALASFPKGQPGRDANAATRGRQARDHFDRFRGRLPREERNRQIRQDVDRDEESEAVRLGAEARRAGPAGQ